MALIFTPCLLKLHIGSQDNYYNDQYDIYVNNIVLIKQNQAQMWNPVLVMPLPAVNRTQLARPE